MVRLSSLHDEQVSQSSSLMLPHAQKTQETSLVRKEDQEERPIQSIARFHPIGS